MRIVATYCAKCCRSNEKFWHLMIWHFLASNFGAKLDDLNSFVKWKYRYYCIQRFDKFFVLNWFLTVSSAQACRPCAMASPDLDRLVNPISTKGGRLCPPNNTGIPGFSDLPTALVYIMYSICTYLTYANILWIIQNSVSILISSRTQWVFGILVNVHMYYYSLYIWQRQLPITSFFGQVYVRKWPKNQFIVIHRYFNLSNVQATY